MQFLVQELKWKKKQEVDDAVRLLQEQNNALWNVEKNLGYSSV